MWSMAKSGELDLELRRFISVYFLNVVTFLSTVSQKVVEAGVDPPLYCGVFCFPGSTRASIMCEQWFHSSQDRETATETLVTPRIP